MSETTEDPMSADPALTRYDELLGVLDHLPILVREKRRRDGLSVRAAARGLGVSFSTLSRVEHGEDCSLATARALLAWVAS